MKKRRLNTENDLRRVRLLVPELEEKTGESRHEECAGGKGFDFFTRYQ
jgi:hypothetical protein